IALVAVACGRRWPAPLRHGILVLAMIKFALPPFAAMPLGIFSQFELTGVAVDSQDKLATVTPASSDKSGGAISERQLPSSPDEVNNSRGDEPSLRDVVAAAGGARNGDSTVAHVEPGAVELEAGHAGHSASSATETRPSWLTCLMLGYLAVMILMATRLSTEIVRLQRLIARANETEAAAELNWRDARSL